MPQACIPNDRKRFPSPWIRSGKMQRRERIRSLNLPFINASSKRRLSQTTKSTIVTSTRNIITKVNSLSQKPNCAIGPVAIRKSRFTSPPTTKALIERRERQPKTFLVCERELNVLDNEDPERSRGQTAGDGAVDVRTDVDGSG